MTTNTQSHPKSICIFRLSAIGDATHVIPVVKTLQARFPDTKLTWVIGQLEHKLLQGLPGVNFIQFNKKDGWKGIKTLRKALQGERFDVLLQMQLSLRANIVSRFIPARRRIGFDRVRSKELHGLVVNERIPYLGDCHVLDGLMQFATHLGCSERLMDWSLPKAAADQAWATGHLSRTRPNVVVSPCSSHELRNWPVENHARLIDQIVNEYRAKVILTGSPAPKEVAVLKAIESACEQPVLNLAGQDTLKQLWCLLGQADLVISPDSGPLHMAGAVGTPVLGLLAASNYLRSGSYHYPDLTVDRYPEACQAFLNRSVSQVKWGTKTEFPGAMEMIKVNDVMDKIRDAERTYQWSSKKRELNT